MDEQGVKKAFILLGTLWQNYKPPQDPKEIDAAMKAWLGFFKGVPEQKVHSAIMEMASDGREFAPNVGQIYAHIKEQKQKALPASTENAAIKLKQWWEVNIRDKYHSKELPTPSETKLKGIQ